MMETACKYCGERMRWIKMRGTGTAHPVDPDLVNVHLRPGIRLITADGMLLAGSEKTKTVVGQGYTSHWATCPYAEQARRDAAERRKRFP